MSDSLSPVSNILFFFSCSLLSHTDICFCPSRTTGEFPPAVQVSENVLKVQNVDESVNTTFVCEVNNQIGMTKEQFGILVRGEFKCHRSAQHAKIRHLLKWPLQFQLDNILNITFQHRVMFLSGNNLICALPCDIMN